MTQKKRRKAKLPDGVAGRLRALSDLADRLEILADYAEEWSELVKDELQHMGYREPAFELTEEDAGPGRPTYPSLLVSQSNGVVIFGSREELREYIKALQGFLPKLKTRRQIEG